MAHTIRKERVSMSVPAWKRAESKAEYLIDILNLNVRVGEIIGNGPKKYRQGYGDFLIKTALDALKYAQTANSIFVSKKMNKSDFDTRRRCLMLSRGCIDSISTAFMVYLAQARKADGYEADKADRQLQDIGTRCYKIRSSIKKVMDSDKNRIR
jgi:hypothetical protein